MYKYLNYDPSAFETASFIPRGLTDWNQDDLDRDFERRLHEEINRRELHVYFYRIGYRISFPLPVTDIPPLPKGIPEMTIDYPWSIWLAWELRERWEILYTAWKKKKDTQAGDLLQNELVSLSNWSRSHEGPGFAGLCTGHLAASLAFFLSHKEDWDLNKYSKVLETALLLLNRDIQPWFENTWASKEHFTIQDIHNIPSIILVSSASLARLLNHPLSDSLDRKSRQLLETWCKFQSEDYSEGTSYDGFLLDSLVQWIDQHPDKQDLIRSAESAFRSVLDIWIHHTLPGRLDLHAPVADTEPEMYFWMNVIRYWVQWYEWKDGGWLINRIPPVRRPATLLTHTLHNTFSEEEPVIQPMKHPASITFRSGWDSHHIAVTVSLNNVDTHHLHYDNGQVVIGAFNRFWITDPGYQQYRQGPERDFSMGPEAHNAPVISGIQQTRHSGKLLHLKTLEQGLESCLIDLTDCYENLPAHTQIHREVIFINQEYRGVIIRDKVSSAIDLTLNYSWQGGTHLAWSFVDGFARLSDGTNCLWISNSSKAINPLQLERHIGSRGPLTLKTVDKIFPGTTEFSWYFLFDKTFGWNTPQPVIDRLQAI